MFRFFKALRPTPLQLSPSVQRVVRLYYLFQFFFAFFLWLPIFYEFQKQVGISDRDIFLIQSIYYWAFCLLEIPTGLLGDRWGYRVCIRLGAVLVAIAGVLPIFFQGYLGFLSHFLLLALSRSLVSGAGSAYLYDYLAKHGSLRPGALSDLDFYKQIEGNARAYSLIGKILFWPCAGWLMQQHLTLPYWLSWVGSLAGVVFAFGFPVLENTDAKKNSQEMKGLSQTFQDVFSILVSHPALSLIMLQGVAVFTLSRIVQVNLFQPFLNEKGFSLATHGLLMSYMTLFETWGSLSPSLRVFGISSKADRSHGDLTAVFLFTGLIALSLILLGLPSSSGWWNQVSVWLGLGAFCFATGATFPIQRLLMNHAIPDSRYRATLLSVESILDRAVCAGVAGCLSSFVAAKEVRSFLVLAGALSLVAMGILWVVFRFLERSQLTELASKPKS